VQEQPLVSVIIPVYNREKFLAAAIDSVFSQTYRPIQVIIVDDGSTDRSGAIARSYKDVEYIYQENQGVSVARNKGVDAAQGEFIAFLDSDDLWLPHKLETQIKYMLQHPEVDITSTKIENFIEAGAEMPSWFNLEDYVKVIDQRIILPTMVMRKVVFLQVGYFLPDWRSGEDTEWIWRSRDFNVSTYQMSEIFTLRRLHGENLSLKTRAEQKTNLFRIMRGSIKRKANHLSNKTEIMQEHPLVSVIIPVYNREKFLAAAINSVFAQTYRPIQVIIVDDGSTDRSGEIARSYRDVEYIYQENQGVSVARNTGIDTAKGEFIAFLDSDDLWLPHKLETQINYMLEHPEVDITSTKIENFIEAGAEMPSGFNFEDYVKVIDQCIILPTMVMRKVVFLQVGYFPHDLRSNEDTEWIWRARDFKVSIDQISEIFTLRRLHGENLSWQTKSEQKTNLFRIMRESIKRKAN
jgi:glycosyltransferase involved in cell wall biosynthesis